MSYGSISSWNEHSSGVTSLRRLFLSSQWWGDTVGRTTLETFHCPSSQTIRSHENWFQFSISSWTSLSLASLPLTSLPLTGLFWISLSFASLFWFSTLLASMSSTSLPLTCLFQARLPLACLFWISLTLSSLSWTNLFWASLSWTSMFLLIMSEGSHPSTWCWGRTRRIRAIGPGFLVLNMFHLSEGSFSWVSSLTPPPPPPGLVWAGRPSSRPFIFSSDPENQEVKWPINLRLEPLQRLHLRLSFQEKPSIHPPSLDLQWPLQKALRGSESAGTTSVLVGFFGFWVESRRSGLAAGHWSPQRRGGDLLAAPGLPVVSLRVFCSTLTANSSLGRCQDLQDPHWLCTWSCLRRYEHDLRAAAAVIYVAVNYSSSYYPLITV